jgi:hypothetical protein
LHSGDLSHAVYPWRGTHSFTSISKEGVLRIVFFRHEISEGFGQGLKPRTVGSKGHHATSRPQKPLVFGLITNIFMS